MVARSSTSMRMAWGCCNLWPLKTNSKLKCFQNLSLCSQAWNDHETVVSLTFNLWPWKTNPGNSFKLSLGMGFIQGFSFDLWPCKSSPLSVTFFYFTYRVAPIQSACSTFVCVTSDPVLLIFVPSSHRKDRARPEIATDSCCSFWKHPYNTDIFDLG